MNKALLTEGDSTVKTNDIGRLYKSSYKRIVIDLLSQHFITYIYIHCNDSHTPSDVLIYQSADSEDMMCYLSEEEIFLLKFFCNLMARIIVIERERGKMTELELYGYATKVEYYVGCFKGRYKEKVHSVSLLEDCAVRCRKLFYYGYNKEEKCICITSVTTLTQVELDLCNNTCGMNLQICGTGSIFAIYSQKIFHKNMAVVNPPWECMYEHSRCPDCPQGRKGYRCEVIDCTENNGNCGDMECQKYDLWNAMTASICKCTKGYKVDNIVNCLDVDECNTGPNPCKTHPKSKCLNLPGTYTCSCAQGYNESEAGSCHDIDECADEEKPCLLDDFCVNKLGGYSCECGPGYTSLEDKACIEVPLTTEMEWADESYTRKKYFLFYVLPIFIILFIFSILAHRRGR